MPDIRIHIRNRGYPQEKERSVSGSRSVSLYDDLIITDYLIRDFLRAFFQPFTRNEFLNERRNMHTCTMFNLRGAF